jgi:hypothetical protein
MMFGSCVPTVVCRRAHVLFMLFVFVCALWCPTYIVLGFYFAYLRLVYSGADPETLLTGGGARLWSNIFNN